MLLRSARLRVLDAVDVIAGRREPMFPPRIRVHEVGGGDFRQIGEHLAALLVDAGALRPAERILDVACGIGRVAVPLTRYLATGEYAGFDVSKAAIDWCRREIASRHPNFWFTRVDVRNDHYNPRGTIDPAAFTFPCADGSVDVAFLGSILTHLTPAAAERYVAETARVLAPGGRAVLTAFLLDDAVRVDLRAGRLAPAFTSFPEPWWGVQDPDDPEAAVAYDLDVVTQALEARGLSIRELSRGAWSGHDGSRTYQDLIVALKQD